MTVRRTRDTEATTTHDFDFAVVCNGVFSVPHVPRLEGQEQFAGSVVHSSQIVDPHALRGKQVVVVGAGKSALDCAAFASREAASCTLLFRTPHWMLPRYFWRARVDRVVFTRASELTLPAHHGATRFEAALRRVGAPVLWAYRRLMSRLVVRLTGIPPTMVPDQVLHTGAENIGIGEAFYEALRHGRARAERARKIAFAGSGALRLDSGERLPADVVVFATGWRQDLGFLNAELREGIETDGRFRLFRNILPPRERCLGFVGYASSANSPLTSELAAHWLSQCFRGELTLPGPAEMEAEVARVRDWTNRVFPKRHEGYFIGGYVAHYADELLRDMGLRTRRTDGLLAEYLAPLWASRYEGLTAERRRARTYASRARAPPIVRSPTLAVSDDRHRGADRRRSAD